MDKWILSRLNTLIRERGRAIWPTYRIPEAARALTGSLWTICPTGMSAGAATASGARAWTGDKEAAFTDPVHGAVHHVPSLTAPFVPFMAESIYQNIVRAVDPGAPESVHLCELSLCAMTPH